MRKFLQRNVWQMLVGIECSVKYEVKITTNTFKEQQNNCNYYFTNFIFFFVLFSQVRVFFFMNALLLFSLLLLVGLEHCVALMLACVVSWQMKPLPWTTKFCRNGTFLLKRILHSNNFLSFAEHLCKHGQSRWLFCSWLSKFCYFGIVWFCAFQ